MGLVESSDETNRRNRLAQSISFNMKGESSEFGDNGVRVELLLIER